MTEIRQMIFIGAPLVKVFDSITTQQGLSGWWTPNVTAAPVQGSVARFGFGPTYVKEMLIDSIVPPKMLRWHCVAGAEEWVGTVLTFQLAAGNKSDLMHIHPEARGQIVQAEGTSSGTVLQFAHTDWRYASLMFAECSYTWGRFLRSLKLLCETGRGLPSPHEHRVRAREDHRNRAEE